MVRRRQKAEERDVLEIVRTSFPAFLPEVDFDLESAETPDFLGKDKSGRVVGLELTRWLNLSQTAAAVKRERIRAAMLNAIDCQRHPHPANISSAVIFPKWDRDIEDRHVQRFGDEFYALVESINGNWDRLRSGHWKPLPPEQRFDHEVYLCDHKQHATLNRYISSIWFREPDKSNPWASESWVSVIPDGGFYQTETSIQALGSVIEKKVIHYSGDQAKAALAAKNLHQLFLLVYTDPDRFSSNASYQTPEQMMKSPTEGLAEAAGKSTEDLGRLPKAFDGIFLFYSAWGSLWLAEIWPRSRVLLTADLFDKAAATCA
jgi:hypothetical protein